MFEWYDFYLYGALAAILAKQFFSALDPTSGFIFALPAFAAGLAMRPFGALLFGRIGDMIGREYTFLVPIVIMGLPTFLVGILPSYTTIGVAAPIILIGLRYVTMVYGPIVAWLVELFPTRIRYTSMSLPYHIGNGWFGGFLPTIAFAMVVASGNIYQGLWYPIVIASMTLVIGTLFLPETKDVDITK